MKRVQHPRFAVGERVVILSAPRWKGCTFDQIGKDGVVVEIQTNTCRLDYVVVEIEHYHHNFTPYEIRPTDPVRALASLADFPASCGAGRRGRTRTWAKAKRVVQSG